ncbi:MULTISPECIES: PAS domain S-box protein [unclassified Methanoculleus]|uniref:PAS domain S-box protein n=1 Tax=unclassified Methanoculleus TaxID=2619537 RepID=UPI0025F8362A|nr:MULTISPECIES: PAS domain S-box protein [unclassified Methanoculleus]MCK9318307.1 PAS domain S-box protein [Methanoculleus sp.]MDD2253585.1 PAS domain S-box protein [Methanoculleus sp.]MDD2787131.1 PAS domain S-box protein [Methanoculleus sp.]MDD3216519.1 PAS domain S-box protein [Methanoculleus sp.]MDD4314553.1 PAS domain S-box protein [Methanoculleus sp.]
MTDSATGYQEQFSRILDLLEEHATTGMSVTAVAHELGITRVSAAKYLELLAANGDVYMERFGQKKLYRRSHRLPLREIFDHSPNALAILDADLRICMVNASFIATLGIRSGHNLIGVPLFDLDLRIFSDIAVRRNIERIHQSETYLEEIQLIDERTDRIYLVNFAPIVSQTESPEILVTLREITALKKIEIALKNSEWKIATLFGTVPNGIIIFAADGAILNANPASLRILGLYTFEQLSAASIFTLACSPGTLESLVHAGQVAEIELACDFDRMRREQIPSTKSGVAYFDVNFTPIRQENGGPPDEFAIVFKDITSDRRERKNLTFRETRYRSLFENACNGVIVYGVIRGGEGFVFNDINRAAEKILGFKKEELIGRNVWDVFPALAEPGLLEAVQQGFARERPVFLPPLQYREGDDVWIWHYLFKLPSGELASLMIDVSTEVCDGNGPPSSPGIR